MLAAACERVEEIQPAEVPAETVDMHQPVTFRANLGTKTILNEDKSVIWAVGDKLMVFDAEGNSEEFTVEEDTDDYSFTTTGTIGDGPYYAIAGYGSATPSFNKDTRRIGITMPSTTDGSFGEADIMASMTDETTFSFHHVFALIKLTVGSSDIKSITFEAAGISSAEEASVGFDDTGALDVTYSQTANTVTIDGIAEAGTYYLPVNPGEYNDGFNFYLTYSDKRMKIEGSSFKASVGKLTNFGNLEGGTPASTTWTLVTDASTLAAGDEIIIAASDYNYAMSTTQNSNNRGVAAISKSADKSTLAAEPGADVQVLTLTSGVSSGTFGLSTGAGYLYAASSNNNYLRTHTTLNANASWNISVTSAGVATIKAQGGSTRNTIYYNQQSSLFSCYSSAQKAVAIYKKTTTPGSGPQMTEISSFLDETEWGVYEYVSETDQVTPLYQFDIRGGAASEGSDQYAIPSGSVSFRMQCLSEGLLASAAFGTSSLTAGGSYSATSMFYGIEGIADGSYSKTYVVKKVEGDKAWLLEAGGTLGLIISTK